MEPIYQKIMGIPERNEKLEVHMPDPGGRTMILTPTVIVAEKDRELRWLGKSGAMYLMENIVFQ